MSEQVYPVPTEWARSALIDDARYREWYARSLADPEGFWREHGRRLEWIRPFTQVKDTSFEEADFRIRWFADGTLNLSANCLDRHLAERGDAVAILWEPDDPAEPHRTLTYRELHQDVCRFANALKAASTMSGLVPGKNRREPGRIAYPRSANRRR